MKCEGSLEGFESWDKSQENSSQQQQQQQDQNEFLNDIEPVKLSKKKKIKQLRTEIRRLQKSVVISEENRMTDNKEYANEIECLRTSSNAELFALQKTLDTEKELKEEETRKNQEYSHIIDSLQKIVEVTKKNHLEEKVQLIHRHEELQEKTKNLHQEELNKVIKEFQTLQNVMNEEKEEILRKAKESQEELTRTNEERSHLQETIRILTQELNQTKDELVQERSESSKKIQTLKTSLQQEKKYMESRNPFQLDPSTKDPFVNYNLLIKLMLDAGFSNQLVADFKDSLQTALSKKTLEIQEDLNSQIKSYEEQLFQVKEQCGKLQHTLSDTNAKSGMEITRLNTLLQQKEKELQLCSMREKTLSNEHQQYKVDIAAISKTMEGLKRQFCKIFLKEIPLIPSSSSSELIKLKKNVIEIEKLLPEIKDEMEKQKEELETLETDYKKEYDYGTRLEERNKKLIESKDLTEIHFLLLKQEKLTLSRLLSAITEVTSFDFFNHFANCFL
jgi:hypothetical protein